LLKRGVERPGAASAAFAVTTPQGSRQIPLTPEFIAPYFPQLEILDLLGQGGMGTVFKARQTKLDRLVAVKIIRPETANDPAFAERFMREARTLARLNHPSIVAVHDFGEINLEADGGPSAISGGTLYFFIMEYVDGANLRQLMQSGPISPQLTLGIVQQVCDALQFAHDEGVVHRDIKPENIMLDTKGRVKIADFGLAKLADRSGADWTLTGTRQVMGTPMYMAPEQLAGSRDVDHRADVYSLAVVFYEMLTGVIPIGHFARPSVKAAVDVRLDDVILKAMDSEPEQRYQSIGDLRSSVAEIAASPGLADGVNASAVSSPGLSTIIDRQVAGAWQILSGRRPDRSGRRIARSDSVVITRGQLEQGLLPDLCMICGDPTTNRETRAIDYQPKWAEAASLGGYMLGGIPGVIVHMMTSHTLHVPCPICEQHHGHWHRRNLYASLAWMQIPLFGGIGFAIGSVAMDVSGGGVSGGTEQGIMLAIAFAVFGLIAYLVPLITMSCNLVKVEQISDGTKSGSQISLNRVCTTFASEVRRRQAAALTTSDSRPMNRWGKE
jgi:predicted Ser/Thr protein kinase